MSTLTPESGPYVAPPPTNTSSASPWLTLLRWASVVVVASDLVFFALIATVVPPLAVGAVLTGLGLWVSRHRRRTGIAILGLTGLVMAAGNLPFAVGHLIRPESAIDFLHAVAGSAGRALVVVAAIGAWRAASAVAARRVTVAAVGLAALSVVVASVATLLATGDEAAADDVPVVIEGGQFPDEVAADRHDTLFIDNQDMFRHTFTVTGTDLDIDLPATQGARVTVDLPPGVYEVLCDVPGHEYMTSTLEVR